LGYRPSSRIPSATLCCAPSPSGCFAGCTRGCYVQITAQSILGRFGTSAQQRAEQWLDEDRVHFIASDAHNLKGRPLQLREAFDAVAQRRGEQVARALFHENPLAVFEGRSLPYEPEQADPSAKPIQYRKRKRFFFFLSDRVVQDLYQAGMPVFGFCSL